MAQITVDIRERPTGPKQIHALFPESGDLVDEESLEIS